MNGKKARELRKIINQSRLSEKEYSDINKKTKQVVLYRTVNIQGYDDNGDPNLIKYAPSKGNPFRREHEGLPGLFTINIFQRVLKDSKRKQYKMLKKLYKEEYKNGIYSNNNTRSF